MINITPDESGNFTPTQVGMIFKKLLDEFRVLLEKLNMLNRKFDEILDTTSLAENPLEFKVDKRFNSRDN